MSLGLLLVAGLLSLGVGSVTLAPSTVVEAFTAFDGSNEHLIVRSLRLPRTLIGVAVDASLAVAGVAMQAITRNALASPTILGVMADPEYDYSSFETLTEHDVDVMLTADFSADGDTEGAEIEQARQQPVFQRLDVVERGELHVFDGGEMVGSAFEKMINFVDFLRETLVERDPTLTPTG